MGQKTVHFTNDNGGRSGADDDVIQTFQLEESHLRGRAVRIGSVLDDILKPHAYPEIVARYVAETVTLAALLSSMLKYDGIFTLQTKGDGPIGMLVADITSEGEIRGCASFDEKRLNEAEAGHSEEGALKRHLGSGYLAFTVDPSDGANRYQGIVEINGANLLDCVQHYFAQSEQIETAIKMAAGKPGSSWRGGAIMLQRLPEDMKDSDYEAKEDDWRRAIVLLSTCTDEELLSPALHSNALLYRLFHEEGIRVYKPQAIRKGCRCDETRVKNMLAAMPAEDRAFMAKEGKIEVRCEFCSRNFVFDLAGLESSIIESRH